jgi:transposase
MCSVRFSLTTYSRKTVERRLRTAHHQGNLRQVKYLRALLAVGDGRGFAEVAVRLRVQEKTVAAWVGRFCGDGRRGAPPQKPPGRPPKLTPTHKTVLAPRMDAGPLQAGYSGACWRSPMIQQLMYERFGVFYHVFSMAPWLKNLGCSYQQAAFVSAPLDAGKRQAWGPTTWPQMLRLANERKALLLCGDEASCPQWGTLAYTWA